MSFKPELNFKISKSKLIALVETLPEEFELEFLIDLIIKNKENLKVD